MKFYELIQRPIFWIALVILLHILAALFLMFYAPVRFEPVRRKAQRTFTPLHMQKVQRITPPKGNSLKQSSPTAPQQIQGPQRPQQQQQQMAQQKPSLPAPTQQGSSEPMQQAAAPQERNIAKVQPHMNRGSGAPVPRRREQAPQKRKKVRRFYDSAPQPPSEPSPLAAIAQGFMNYQNAREVTHAPGTESGKKFGDLKHMKYVSYWKRFQEHFNVSWRIIYNELPHNEMMHVTGKPTYKNVTYRLHWDTTGKLLEATQIESSGSDIFDAAVARLMHEASPVPPIPPSFNVKTMSVPFVIGPGVVANSIPDSFGYT